MLSTSVYYIDKKGVNLLMVKVYFAFLFCFSLSVWAQTFVFLSDSSVISIKEGTRIIGIHSENPKTKIYVFEGTSIKNFDIQNLTNADIVQVQKGRYSDRKQTGNKPAKSSFSSTSKNKNIRKTKSPAIKNADSKNNLFAAKLAQSSILAPLSLQWGKALQSRMIKVEDSTVFCGLVYLLFNELSYHLNSLIAFKVRPPPLFFK